MNGFAGFVAVKSRMGQKCCVQNADATGMRLVLGLFLDVPYFHKDM